LQKIGKITIISIKSTLEN